MRVLDRLEFWGPLSIMMSGTWSDITLLNAGTSYCLNVGNFGGEILDVDRLDLYTVRNVVGL